MTAVLFEFGLVLSVLLDVARGGPVEEVWAVTWVEVGKTDVGIDVPKVIEKLSRFVLLLNLAQPFCP